MGLSPWIRQQAAPLLCAPLLCTPLLCAPLLCTPLLCALALVACDPGSTQSKKGQSDSISNEPSPNASILPEPLGEKKDKGESDVDPLNLLSATPVVVPRARPTAFSLRQALPEDEMVRGGLGAGYEAQARIVWPQVQSNVVVSGKKIETWPHFSIQLLRELPEHPARLRVVLTSPVFPLIEGTEIRMRADRIGALIVWPDQRSYRTVAPGTMSALFSDKRADRLPFVEPKVSPPEQIVQTGRTNVRTRFETTLGTGEMELSLVPDLPYAAPLLCQLLLDMVRVSASEELCPRGGMPVRLQVNWKSGGGFLFEVLSYKQNARLQLDQQRMPPALPIFKRGELPPSDEYLWPASLREQLLPVKLGDFSPRPQALAPAETTNLPPTKESSSTDLGLAPDEVELKNRTHRPLMVQLDRVPYFWLGPGETKSLRVRGAPISYGARDFWGQIREEPSLVSAPARVIFGPQGPEDQAK